MDGQRRFAGPVSGNAPRVYRRAQGSSRVLAIAERKRVRFAVRAGAVLFLGATILHGLLAGGHFDYEGSPWLKLPGKLSGFVGFAAEDIKITGLNHQDPAVVLKAIGVRPGGSLIGFDASEARRRLEGMDWVAAASVQRLFPNQLQISVAERVPFAVWQINGSHYVIDRAGMAMSGFDPSIMPSLPLVTGEGANGAAEELVNQLSAVPDLLLKVKAAARVGQRRWTLYLDSGIRIALPEEGVEQALARVAAMDASQHVLSKGIQAIDLRIPGEMSVMIAEVAPDGAAAKQKLSLNQ